MSIKSIGAGSFALDVRVWHEGREYRRRETFDGGKKAAALRHRAIERELGEKSAKGSLKYQTFADALSFYKQRKDLGKSLSYITRLENEIGDVPIDELADRFDLWLQAVRTTVKTGTVNCFLAWSTAALNLAVRHGHIKENPLRFFRREREIPRDRLLSPDEKAALLYIVEREAPHLLPIVRFALAVPSRRGELVSMRREWFDEINFCIHIPATATKGKTPVTKPIPESLREYMKSIPIDCPWIFYRKDRYGYQPLGDFKRSWKRCLRLAGIENFRFHDTRRGSYTDLILAGNAPHVVQKVSGHRTDMSRVYLNISNIQAAQAIRFSPETGHSTGHLTAVNSLSH